MDQRRRLGQLGEDLAAEHLRQAGYAIIARNFRCRLGEIDIIAHDGTELVFIEVRTRSTSSFASPEESITGHKQSRLRRVASYYLLATGQPEQPARFDVVTIVSNIQGQIQRLDLYRNAF